MDAKKDKEQDKDKAGSNKEVDGDRQQQPGAGGAEAKAGEAGPGSQARGPAHGEAAGSSQVGDDGANARPNDEAQSPVDALMNADSDDDDDDVHGEGSQSQQHDLALQVNQLQ